MKDSKQELLQIIAAIKIVRQRWVDRIDQSVTRIMAEENIDRNRATAQAVVLRETQEEFQNLLNLYAIVGNNADEYVAALTSTRLSDIGKKAA